MRFLLEARQELKPFILKLDQTFKIHSYRTIGSWERKVEAVVYSEAMDKSYNNNIRKG